MLLALAAAAGFAAAATLADLRTQTLAESDAGTLSLEVRTPEDTSVFDLAELPDGRLASAIVLQLTNSGPRPVALRSVELVGTAYTADDVAGRRVSPGGQTRVALLRPVDCDDPEPTGGTTTVLVRALTDAGEREQRLHAALDPWLMSGELGRRACGDIPPTEALSAAETSSRFDDGGLLLELELRNESADVLTLRAVRPATEGIALELLTEDGAPLHLPLRVPAGDFTRPRPLSDPARAATVRLAARIQVVSCEALPRHGAAFEGGPFALVDVDGEHRSGTTLLGDAYSLLSRLRAESCAPSSAAS